MHLRIANVLLSCIDLYHNFIIMHDRKLIHVVIELLGVTKINLKMSDNGQTYNFEPEILVDKDVFRFEVSVHNVIRMYLVKCFD
jgi:hypothetical protein